MLIFFLCLTLSFPDFLLSFPNGCPIHYLGAKTQSERSVYCSCRDFDSYYCSKYNLRKMEIQKVKGQDFFIYRICRRCVVFRIFNLLAAQRRRFNGTEILGGLHAIPSDYTPVLQNTQERKNAISIGNQKECIRRSRL
jgi:hypothetical protein